MPIQDLAYMVYFVTDMARAKQFYTEKLGLTISADRGAWVQFNLPGGVFALHQSESDAGNNAGDAGGIIGFNVTEIESLLGDLQASDVKVDGEIREERFGKLANIKDPDGNLINLIQRN